MWLMQVLRDRMSELHEQRQVVFTLYCNQQNMESGSINDFVLSTAF